MSALGRRPMLGGFGCACALHALAACGADGGGGDSLAAGYHPSAATDEGGLWQAMDRLEGEVRRSRQRVRDAALDAYVRDVACRLAGDLCPDLRVYVMRTPAFNAMMAPNGMMQVWTGLLLRCRNEAQLAAVLGHEIAHYRQRHALKNWRAKRDTADLLTFLSLGLSAAGAGAAVRPVWTAANAGLLAFSRDQEREADAIGLELMVRAGYAPTAAAENWTQMNAEQAADRAEARAEGRTDRDEAGSVFLSTHPSNTEREHTLAGRAADLAAPGQREGADEHRRALQPLRLALFDDELRQRRFAATAVLLDRLLADQQGEADLHTASGDLHRLRAAPGDDAAARAAYETAIALPSPPATAWRGYGLLLRRQGEPARAEDALRRYLLLTPDAPDRALIQSYLGA